VVDGGDSQFVDLKFSSSKTNVAVQWEDFYDPECGIREYETRVMLKR